MASAPCADDKVTVFLRIRGDSSSSGGSARRCILAKDPASLNGALLQCAPDERRPTPPELYSFDGVLDASASQADVFDATLRGFIPRVLAGLNCTLLAYGQTGSGKTHTTIGATDARGEITDHGLVLRAMHELFSSAGEDELDVTMQALELYNVSGEEGRGWSGARSRASWARAALSAQ